MSSQSIDVVDELNRLVAEGVITERALQAMTRIDSEKLHTALAGEKHEPGTLISADQQVLTSDESMRLSILAAQLTDGMTIGDDDRLKAIIESLNAEMHLSTHHIAQLTGVDAEDLESVLNNPRSVPIEVKYAIAIKGSYLMNTANLARGR